MALTPAIWHRTAARKSVYHASETWRAYQHGLTVCGLIVRPAYTADHATVTAGRVNINATGHRACKRCLAKTAI